MARNEHKVSQETKKTGNNLRKNWKMTFKIKCYIFRLLVKGNVVDQLTLQHELIMAFEQMICEKAL